MTAPKTEKKSAFAARCGISAARVSQLVKDGLPVAPNGEVLIDEATAWMDGRMDPTRRQAAKPATAPTAKQKVAMPAAEEADEGEGGPEPVAGPDAPIRADDLTEAKRLNEIEKIRLSRIKREAERKALVSRDVVKRGLHEFGMAQRDAWIAWCGRAAPDVAAELGVDLQKAFAILDRLVREQLIHLAGSPLPPALKEIASNA